MTVVFVSNYINHHQIPFCDAMYRRLGEEYHFIQTEPMEEERIRMGWGGDFDALPWLMLFYERAEECRRLILESDVVLFGGVEDESYIVDRLHAGRLTVRMSERLYREGQWKAVSPRGLRKKYIDHTQYRKKNVYLLCSGAYVASDFHIVRAYPGKMFKWGYFPEAKEYDIEKLLEEKRERRRRTGKVSILWAGRFMKLKHPEYALRMADRLKREGYDFTLTMVGGGDMEAELRCQAAGLHLENDIVFAGFKKPREVRQYMEEADIFLFTSDYREGWGAVVNEAMNSGCAAVVNCAVGAAPFLIRPGVNGLLYPNGRFEVFYRHVTELIHSDETIDRLGREAYRTIREEWNAERAADKLLKLLENLWSGRVIFEEAGVLSRAPVVSPRRMYRYLLSGKGDDVR